MEDGRERLVLRRGRNATLVSEVREEVADLFDAQLGGVALLVEEDEAPVPLDVSLLGADAIVKRRTWRRTRSRSGSWR